MKEKSDKNNSEYSIIFNDVVKTFGEATILDQLNFQIHRGKITTLLGFSGAGKSTILKHILGILRPTSGNINVLGQEMDKMSELDLRDFRKNFGMVFQYAALFDSMNTFENVAFPLREFTDFKEAQIKEKVFELLDSTGLHKESYFRMPSELSGGMRKRVGLARALALKPEIMLYDEPTTGLDPITTHTVDDLIVGTHEKNQAHQMTTVIISHDISATLRISDYIAFLERGRVVEHSSVEDFKKSENPTIRRFLEL